MRSLNRYIADVNVSDERGTPAIHNSIQCNGDGHLVLLELHVDGIHLNELGSQIIRQKVEKWWEMTRKEKHDQRGESETRAVIGKRRREESEGEITKEN